MNKKKIYIYGETGNTSNYRAVCRWNLGGELYLYFLLKHKVGSSAKRQGKRRSRVVLKGVSGLGKAL